ncbi:MAG: hypothetical protein JJU42_02970, partial [Rhodobacteraceae bacterium]|nr:hypothetical protein [Paracoccaceae bacterium]
MPAFQWLGDMPRRQRGISESRDENMTVARMTAGSDFSRQRGTRVGALRRTTAHVAPALALAAVSALMIAPVTGGAETITGPETTTQVVAPNANLTITPTGSVIVTAPDTARAVYLDDNYAGTFDNQGTVAATAAPPGGG